MKYCRNCRYHESWEWDAYSGACCNAWYRHPALCYPTRDHIGNRKTTLTDKGLFLCTGDEKRLQTMSEKFLLNTEFSCEFYERKWWKFWVKDEDSLL